LHNAAVAEESRDRRWWWLYGVLVAVTVGYLWAGYGEGWAWTGLNQPVTLWDWLEGLALPVTVGLVPLLLRHRSELRRTHKATGMALLAAFAVLVVLGYAVPMAWTGFTGNTLWDWLSLALLPVVIATSTLWRPPPHWSARHVGLLVTAGMAAVLLVLAGYLVPWAWTGFQGNTAWDWIKLLLLPVLLPTVVMPRLLVAADDWMTPDRAAGR
jgi:heme/copper-type cytochrome/quinol oxidase subunit 4